MKVCGGVQPSGLGGVQCSKVIGGVQCSGLGGVKVGGVTVGGVKVGGVMVGGVKVGGVIVGGIVKPPAAGAAACPGVRKLAFESRFSQMVTDPSGSASAGTATS